MFEVSRLYTYPIKSLAEVQLSESQLTDRGLWLDRRWLLIDLDGTFLSQRTHPELVLFKVFLQKEGLVVSHDNDTVEVPLVTNSTQKLKAKVWDDEFEVIEVSKKISMWFSDKLSKDVKLVYQPDSSIRGVDPRYATSATQQVSAADGYPVLIISEESLEGLNERLDESVEMERFRPNIVVKGVKNTHDEDKWQKISIGESSLLGVKNCARCIMTTNDIKTGVFGKEPMRTLARYRKEGSKVLFGRNFIPTALGIIRIGDKVSVVTQAQL